jgi:hypothetical protein
MDSKKPASPEKVASNRANSARSTGPRTEAGKAKAAQNSYKHGFFALRLFPNDKLRAQDAADYNMVYESFCSHYAPVGDMELFWLEKIATEALRIARVLGYGQEVLGWRMPFENHSVDRLLHYESTVNRNFAHAIKNLELLQAQRKAESSQHDEPTDPEPDPATGESEPTAHEPSSASEEPVAQEPTSVSTSEAVSEAHPTAEDDSADATESTEPTPSQTEPTHQPTETVQNPTPPTEICETNPTFSSRWIETPEDQKLVDELRQELDDIFTTHK